MKPILKNYSNENPMKNPNTLTNRFNKFRSENFQVGDYIILSMAVRGMKYNKTIINRSFNKLVPKDDYAPNERDHLLEKLYIVTQDGLTKPLENDVVATDKIESPKP